MGRLLQATAVGADAAALVLRYKVQLSAGFPHGAHDDLYVYSDGRFHRLAPEAETR